MAKGCRSWMLAAGIAVGLSSANSTEVAVKLTPADQAVFCGVDGHEAGPKYGQTVNAEVTWRMAAGARTPAQALGLMRAEYCLAKAGETK